MRVFVGYGYNQRDAWVERDLIPLLEAFQMTVLDGKEMPGQPLDQEIQRRIEQSHAVVAFFTLREGRDPAAYNSHDWVLHEALYAFGNGKPVIPVREAGVTFTNGIFGDRQFVPVELNGDKLGCVSAVVRALRNHWPQRLRLQPNTVAINRAALRAKREGTIQVLYRTRIAGVDSEIRPCSIDFEEGIYVEVDRLPPNALVEVTGKAAGRPIFTSQWAPVDAVQIEVG